MILLAQFFEMRTENGLEIWRRLRRQFAVFQRVRAASLLNELLLFKLRNDQLGSDLSDFIIVENRHKKATGGSLDNDLPISLFMQKTTGPMQQHLGFNEVNVRNINTFGEVRETVTSYLNSKLVVPSMKNDGGPADMDVGKGDRKERRKRGSMEKVFTKDKEKAQAKERTKARKGKREGCKGMRG